MYYSAFLATCLVILLTPGPTNTLLAASGAALGFRRAFLLPFAEVLGYGVAVGAFLGAANLLGELPFAMPALKAAAATWLLFSAAKLWRDPVTADTDAAGAALWRVFFTTILNPKAMLVGAIVIPAMMAEQPVQALLCFLALSALTGMAWLMAGSALPPAVRPYSYKAAALVLGAFSMAAAIGSLQG